MTTISFTDKKCCVHCCTLTSNSNLLICDKYVFDIRIYIVVIREIKWGGGGGGFQMYHLLSFVLLGASKDISLVLLCDHSF